MRRTVCFRTVLGSAAIGIAIATTAPVARAEMCTPAIKDCESQADAYAERCTLQCARFDTICADRCDDTHDVTVHYCWIKAALCKAADRGHGYAKALSDRR